MFGYDINPDYLHACQTRYNTAFGDRLHLVQSTIGPTLRIEPVDLLIANLIIEYVGLDRFVAFATANSSSVGVLSCVIQRNDTAAFVSSTDDSHSFDVLATIASDIDADALASAMTGARFRVLDRREYPLPNGKALVRVDFQAEPRAAVVQPACSR